MAITEFSAALNQICSERGVDPAIVLDTIEQAMVAAFRKDYGGGAKYVRAEVDKETGETRLFKMFFEQEAAEEGITGEKKEVEILKKDPDHPDLPGIAQKVTMIESEVTPPGFGRIAAQTAKQVIVQKLREEEKAVVKENYTQKVGLIVSGNVYRMDKGVVVLDLGKAQGLLLPLEQIPGESYVMGQRVKAIVEGVRDGLRSPEVMLSRTAPSFVEELFALEVPEIGSGVVEVKGVSREPGNRSKVAVASNDEKVDPVGSCVGQKGVRVQAVIEELNGEKIDIIPHDPDSKKFVANALAPATVKSVERVGETHEFKVSVAEDQLSLAIGKEGQNVRLAAKLTGFKIDIKGIPVIPDKDLAEVEGLSARTLKALKTAKFETLADLAEKSPAELKGISGIGPKAVAEITAALREVAAVKNEA
ncbi:MAG: transcription termination factor NusA [bacterium]